MADALTTLERGLIVSCQPVRGGFLDAEEVVKRTAQAVISAGAVAVRIEGARDLAAVVPHVAAPVVGLVKRQASVGEAFITATWNDLEVVLRSGAQIVAIEATSRPSGLTLAEAIEAVHARGRLVMADVSTFEEGLAAWKDGADLVGTTLSGYTPASASSLVPDILLVAALAQAGVRVIAEGHYDEPVTAAAAIEAGAFAVTVGSAITRPEHVTSWYLKAIAVAEISDAASG